ncbi:hypothetical protein Y032_0532g3040 [Ancylostoma ceylanicum]|uniref:Uncharacterized protein n=1 Tax=Ancylostoma ceylanicum TaxID=53326 RepID=A0A016WRG8_9BILA|nr:hypothetical protein Y032_0532g3040 [Ancylostoma ceylanicum]
MPTGVIQHAEREYDNHFVHRIDLSILLTFRNSWPWDGEDMTTGVLQCAKLEYDNHIPRKYRVIDFVDFSALT